MQSKNVVCKKLSDASNTQHFWVSHYETAKGACKIMGRYIHSKAYH
jgi:hypothetical protein